MSNDKAVAKSAYVSAVDKARDRFVESYDKGHLLAFDPEGFLRHSATTTQYLLFNYGLGPIFGFLGGASMFAMFAMHADWFSDPATGPMLGVLIGLAVWALSFVGSSVYLGDQVVELSHRTTAMKQSFDDAVAEIDAATKNGIAGAADAAEACAEMVTGFLELLEEYDTLSDELARCRGRAFTCDYGAEVAEAQGTVALTIIDILAEVSVAAATMFNQRADLLVPVTGPEFATCEVVTRTSILTADAQEALGAARQALAAAVSGR